MEYVVDTHALLWYLSADRKLGKKAKQALAKAESGEAQLVIPIVVLLEILVIIEKKRIKVTWSQFTKALIGFPRLIVYPLGLELLSSIRNSNPGLELHDRIIVATAKIHQAPLITLDPEISQLGKVKILW